MKKEILLSTPVQKQFSKLTSPFRKDIKEALKDLASGKDRKLDIKKLKGVDKREPLYRLRVGKYRVVYKPEKKVIKVIRIILRKEGYDWL